MPYHLTNIKKGTFGEVSKIQEELDELKDALLQNNRIMAAVEMSDLYGALEEVAKNMGFDMVDLAIMSAATKSAFKDGTRK